jgi:hypothetical protein
MDKLFITHYYFPGTDPWKNIMNLPEQEAFRMAAELAEKHPDTTSFGRFADFENYYPNRKRADEFVRNEFKNWVENLSLSIRIHLCSVSVNI